MITITIDIQDYKFSEVLEYLKNVGVEVRETEILKFADTTEYLLSSAVNAQRLSQTLKITNKD